MRRLCRIARFGTVQPREPDFASAFRAIGPAAIKLGQSLATRPDVVGEDAVRNLLTLQDCLPPTPFAALSKVVELGRVTQNHLGRQVAMDPATIQGVIKRLTVRGLIERTHDPMDRRTAVLAPTEAALELIATAVACAQRAHATALSPLSDDEQAVFLTLLRKMG